ncbi:MAG TPA: gfo/Idh/MocA family oxidoreductase, partial [Lentisphaeria bacterium]|nr:gfo/Idh/MocA family oxidoreductase [Lentisphaeria bacterium]
MTNIALIGGGHIHAPSFIKRINEDAEIQAVAVWDQDAGRAAERAEALSAPVVSLDEIWADASIPAVVICSETDQHEELVLASAAAGKDMFVEKPLGMAAADSYSMAAAIREAGVKFQTGYFNRANAAHMFIRGQLAAGAFGTVTRVRHSNCHSGALAGWFDSDWRWMADPAIAGCGAYGDLGTHSLDLLLWLFGEVEQVTGSIMSVTDRYPGCDETGEGFLKFKSGVIGSIAASWVDVGNPITLQVFGTEGWATV